MVTRTKKLFIGGLSASSTVDDVRGYFEQFGKVGHLPLTSVDNIKANCILRIAFPVRLVLTCNAWLHFELNLNSLKPTEAMTNLLTYKLM